MQPLHARLGDARDLVIGVRTSGGEFAAHAWLSGCETDRKFHEIVRLPAQPVMAPPGSALVAAAVTMAIDRLTLEVTSALEARGIGSLLVKGPVLADWLYPDKRRPYGDTDLLVAPDDLDMAQQLLRDLGFRPIRHPEAMAPGTMPAFHAWTRQGMWVDLDCRMAGLMASPALQWEGLSRRRERWLIGQSEVWTCSPEARALLLATHAAHHGLGVERPLEDLRRGISRLPLGLWGRAWDLARELEATDAFSAGLCLLSSGAALADKLGVPREVPQAVRLKALGAPPLAMGLHRLAATPGLRAKIALGRRELLPSAAFLRWWSPIARRGPLGLLAARIWRPLWFLGQVPSALRVWVGPADVKRGHTE